jgi:hypothetical protein
LTASRTFHNHSVHFLCFADLRLLNIDLIILLILKTWTKRKWKIAL